MTSMWLERPAAPLCDRKPRTLASVGPKSAGILVLLTLGAGLTTAANSLTNVVPFPDIAVLMCILILFLTSLLAVLGFAESRVIDSNKVALTAILVIWCFLLMDDDFFTRVNPIDSALEGSFPPTAYGQIVFWLFTAVVLVIVSLPASRQLPKMLLSGSCKWMTLFALFSFVSVTYSPRPLYSLAWAFKLCLSVWLILLAATLVRTQENLLAFLRVTLLGFASVVILAFFQMFFSPAMAFEGGRLSGLFDATNLSEKGALVLLLSLTLYSVSRRKSVALLVLLGASVMVLGGGKMSITAGVFCSALFFLIRKKIGSAVALLSGMCLLMVMSFLFAPTGLYLQKYVESEQLSNLTGRLPLWIASLEAVSQRWLWGHGYLSSKFISVALPHIEWQAGSMHNSFLEVLYNNGVIGLIPILAMNVGIVRNLIGPIKHKRSGELYLLAVGLLVIYLDLLIDGFFKVTFGGRPYAFFMLFLSVVMLADKLRVMDNSATPNPHLKTNCFS